MASLKENDRKWIGFYGGTFDPPHFGHINLAIEIFESKKLDEIWFCPAQINPHKQSSIPSASMQDRIQMLNIALEDLPQFRVIENESKRMGPSYTIDTLKELIKIHENEPNKNFCLLIGDDSAANFHQWKQAEEIIQLMPIYTGYRQLTGMRSGNAASPLICDALEKGRIKTHYIEISSTEIRQRLKEGLYCGHLVPAKVLDYIYENHLYSTA